MIEESNNSTSTDSTSNESVLETSLFSFEELTTYFKEKYLTDNADPDFVSRANHFFNALLTILEDGRAPKLDTIPRSMFPRWKHRYKDAYATAFDIEKNSINAQEVTPAQVKQYLVAIAKESRMSFKASSNCTFYESFFVNIFPILFSNQLGDIEFDSIVDNIPGSILLEAQEKPIRNQSLASSPLFTQLRESNCPSAISRFTKIASHFPKNIKGNHYHNNKLVLNALHEPMNNELEQLSKKHKIPRHIAEYYADCELLVYQALLLSGRDSDQDSVMNVLDMKMKTHQQSFVAQMLLDSNFLSKLKNSKGSVKASMIICKLLKDLCQKGEDKKNIKSRLNFLIEQNAEKNENKSLVEISAISSEACADFFGMLNPKIMKNAYTAYKCKAILSEIEALPDSQNRGALFNIMTFITYCVHSTTKVDLFAHCNAICQEKESDERTAYVKAACINAYLSTQLVLYPEALSEKKQKRYTAYMDKLKEAFPELSFTSYVLEEYKSMTELRDMSKCLTTGYISNNTSSFLSSGSRSTVPSCSSTPSLLQC